MPFTNFFQTATGQKPFDFQSRFAEECSIPSFVNIPTGCGKTAMAILGWIWRSKNKPDETPRRLVYCLPMRVLVEQTYHAAVNWCQNLQEANHIHPNEFDIHLLMGGEVDRDWTLSPEKRQILIGTQDMLLSRALNRGYASSRARWPFEFGLLNNDCIWVFDEVQLMGNGLATTAQLKAFRDTFKTWGNCPSLWMSATIQPSWLKTVDYSATDAPIFQLYPDEAVDQNSVIGRRLHAQKTLHQYNGEASPAAKDLAKFIIEKHQPPSTTLVIRNTVERAIDLYKEVLKTIDPKKKLKPEEKPHVLLLHSHFRPNDRQQLINKVMSEQQNPSPKGCIVISTQVIEAGVDMDADLLFTDLAPWSSMVQRFGRCNRFGEKKGQVWWIDLNSTKDYKPYIQADLDQSRTILLNLNGRSIAPSDLPEQNMAFKARHVIRQKDLVDLFDTTPDLAGNDIDISRYIREGEDHDVHVFWRNLDGEEPTDSVVANRNELCSVSIFAFRNFLKKLQGSSDTKINKNIYRWDFLNSEWTKITYESDCYPGLELLLDGSAGGYSPGEGWNGEVGVPVPILEDLQAHDPESNDSDTMSLNPQNWLSIAEHTQHVVEEIDSLVNSLSIAEGIREVLKLAARWHDRGKAHELFQAVLPEDRPEPEIQYAKGAGPFKKYSELGRPHFRHELASALALLSNKEIKEEVRNLAAYLVAAHHGKVRLSIRSLPGETIPEDGKRFARGLWEGDLLPQTDLGGGVVAPQVELSLEPMELGLSENGDPSWIDRMISLRDSYGPFQMAFFEALVRAADCRASKREQGEQL